MHWGSIAEANGQGASRMNDDPIQALTELNNG
jgi:hypothetical protein